jgi:hypothetical protein
LRKLSCRAACSERKHRHCARLPGAACVVQAAGKRWVSSKIVAERLLHHFAVRHQALIPLRVRPGNDGKDGTDGENEMKTVICAFVLLWPLAALAMTGNELLVLCNGTSKGEANADAAKYSTCTNFLYNASDPPSWASDERLRQVWLAYVQKHPEELSWDAGTSVINAYTGAFPERRN